MTAGPGKLQPLPRRIPIFPLSGALLLPGGELPLNIFEPRYLAMTRAALGGDRCIGMVQPSVPDQHDEKPAVYGTGCLGLLDHCEETEDGRLLIRLHGISRFHIVNELATATPYRVVEASYAAFARDLASEDHATIDRDQLVRALAAYLKARRLDADWRLLGATPTPALVNALATICPFAANEKQALLEAAGLAERAELLLGLFRIGAETTDDDTPKRLH